MGDIKRLEAKIDSVLERVHSIDTTLVAQHESLKEHMRRTDLLEKKLEPVEKQVIMAQGAIKLLGSVGLIVAIIKAFHFLSK